jgi:hypothetical protein
MNVHTSTMAINCIFFNKIFIVQINFKRRLVMVCNKFCLKKYQDVMQNTCRVSINDCLVQLAVNFECAALSVFWCLLTVIK